MSSGKSDLPVRAASALVMVALAFAAIWFGYIAFWLMLAIAGVLMMGEWSELAKETDGRKRLAQYAVSVPLAAMCPIALGPSFIVLGLVGAAAFFTAIVLRRGQMGWGAIYVGLPILSLVFIRAQEHGFMLTLWTMPLVWASDTGAYFAGRTIGGPKLAPSISPNKTWAGFLGGVASAGVFGALTHVYAALPLELALATPLLAAFSQVGDLYESHLKRQAGVKDSGNILPGHGGLMDRLDGLVFVAPFAALLILLLK